MNMEPREWAHKWKYPGGRQVEVLILEDGPAPEIFAARAVPPGESPLYGYGTTEAEAIVDLFRAQRRTGDGAR